jgi:transposase
VAHALLTSVPGIGNILAYYLICYLPELGKLSHKAIAALAGVAPFNHDSGKHQGKRFIQGGRSMVRQMLYMAAMTSITFNPTLRVFYQRLVEQGKPGKVALVAVMRKLLSIVNSIMSRQTPWQESY